MYSAIVLMPLIGSILSGFFGRKIGVRGSQFITCGLIISTAILAILVFIEVGLSNTPVSISLSRWLDIEYLNVFIGFNFDSLTTLMLLPVLFVSSAVHVYSIGYMSHDPHNQRFFSYLSLFTFMMIILVTSNNYLLMFVGWEGVGICSYLLVNFWFTRIAANQSSIAAILTNRVGDCLLTIGMFAILWSLGNLDYATVFSLAPFINENTVTIIGICLLIGAMAKSSQIGLHVWLPMAMEGPTPVSALIHAATMVTAGVYLLIRSSPLIEYSTTLLLTCLWIGAITTLFSSLIGLFQQDIKKVIAYSTMSQLGLMVVAIGLSSYSVALFHLVNHAFYKALLFLGAGAVIHAVADKQDFRKYGGLKQFLPLSYSVMFIASLSLVAFPFMTGFFSKDFILESSYGKFHLSSIIVYYIATTGAMFTTLYWIKTLYLTFIANPNGSLIDHKNVHEGNIYMSLPLVILALFSIYFGFITKDMFIGLGSDLFIDNSIFIHPHNDIMINTEFAVATVYKLLPFVLTVSLTFLSLLTSEYLIKNLIQFKFTSFGYNLFSFFNLRFSVELIYNRYITNVVFKLGEHTTRILDKGAIELVGPYGLQNNTHYLSRMLSSLDTSIVTTYALYILMGGLTYMMLPYILLYAYNIIIIKLSMIIYYHINYKMKSNKISTQNVQSKINYKYYVKKIARLFIIATILFFIRSYIIYKFDVQIQYYSNYISIWTISAALNEIISAIWAGPTPQVLGGPQPENKPDYSTPRNGGCGNYTPTPTVHMSTNDNSSTSSPTSTANASPVNTANASPTATADPSASSSRSASPPDPNYVLPEQGEGYGPVPTETDVMAFNNRDRLIIRSAGTPENQRKITTPITKTEDLDSTDDIVYVPKGDKNFNEIGARTTVYNRNRELLALIEASYVPGNQNRHNNPIQRSNVYEMLRARSENQLNESIANNTASDAQGNDTQATKQLKYEMLFYTAKKREAWGVYNGVTHRALLRTQLSDTDNQLVTPREHELFSHNDTPFPGTAPTLPSPQNSVPNSPRPNSSGSNSAGPSNPALRNAWPSSSRPNSPGPNSPGSSNPGPSNSSNSN